ncbi:MAG TPA: PAS domain S-box protein, partial [Actinomycetota bacterium]|nr:PAS domain S-box protein [Actinomycetota bacterium]
MGRLSKLMVVEDDDTHFERLRSVLSSQPVSLIRVHSGDDRWRHLDGAVDVLLLTVSSLTDVYEIDQVSGSIPIVVMTGQQDQELALIGLARGAVGHLFRESIDADSLMRTLRYSIERFRVQRSLLETQANYKVLFANIPVPKWVYDEMTLRFLAVNDAAVETYGYSEAEFLSMSVRDLLIEEDLRRGLEELGRTIDRGALPPEGVVAENAVRHRVRSGAIIDIEVASSHLSFEGRPAIFCAISDVTARRRAEARLAAQHAVTRVFAEAEDLSRAGPQILQAIGESLGWDLGVLWLMDRVTRGLHCISLWKGHRVFAPDSERLTRSARLSPREGIPGTVWAGRSLRWFGDLKDDPTERIAAAHREGFRSALAVPVGEGIPRGVLEFLTRESRAPEPDVIALVETVGTQLGLFLERKEATADLREREVRLSAILRSSLDSIILMDHRGLITEFNDSAERVFGFTRDEAVGRLLADLIIPPDQRKSHSEGLRRFHETGEEHVIGKRIERTALRADGSTFPIELTVTAMDLPGPAMFVGSIRDLTTQKQATAALRVSEGKYRQLLEQASDGIAVADAQGRLETVNPRMCQLLAQEEKDLVGLRFVDLIDLEEGGAGALDAVVPGESVLVDGS